MVTAMIEQRAEVQQGRNYSRAERKDNNAKSRERDKEKKYSKINYVASQISFVHDDDVSPLNR